MDAEAVINYIFDQCPISVAQAQKIKPSLRKDGTWSVTFGSDYGDFLYVVDSKTGEILENNEPDIEAARAAGTAKEKLTVPDAINAALKAASVSGADAQDIKASSKPDGSFVITFKTSAGEYMFVVDGSSGKILDSIVP